MEQPLVSVVVVSYNQARYITENLDSLKAQTYKNWELIVADDASHDDSTIKFENWLAENKVEARQIFHRNNTGLPTVLNEAVELCTGKYIKLIAADDYMHPDCLEKSVKCLEEKGNAFGMVFTDAFCIDEHSHSLPDLDFYKNLQNISAEDFRDELLKANPIVAPTVLLRADVLRETGKYDSRFIVEDYYRWLQISEKYFIAHLPEKLTYYRWHAGNISRTKTERIDIESYMLKIMFDHKGAAKDKINRFIAKNYYAKKAMPADLLMRYSQYSFRNKMLLFCIKNRIPVFIYQILNKVTK